MSIRKLIGLAVLVLVLGLTASSCSSDPGPEPDPSFSFSFDTGPGDETTGSTGQLCLPGNLEGCYTYDEMRQFIDDAIPMVEGYFDATYDSMSHPTKYFFAAEGEVGQSGCGGTYGAENFEYCPLDNSVYVGQRMTWDLYTGAGDAGPIIALAHEWGHHVQNRVGVPPPETVGNSIVHENQADCIAGAWAGYADEQGMLVYPDDISDIGQLMVLLGSAEGPDRDHGTASERSQFFVKGFREGLVWCNRFYPATPLIIYS